MLREEVGCAEAEPVPATGLEAPPVACTMPRLVDWRLHRIGGDVTARIRLADLSPTVGVTTLAELERQHALPAGSLQVRGLEQSGVIG